MAGKGSFTFYCVKKHTGSNTNSDKRVTDVLAASRNNVVTLLILSDK